MGKYKFRKMYFVCKDKQVISPDVQMTNAYQSKDTADAVCKQQQRDYKYLWETAISKKTVEGFYLVPEALFEEVLKKWVEE
ncbi:hypothetical protein ACFSJU_14865 [Paradesertivirga mongoliensis]|uniref:Uncharacterized protein n=1 Tax=Paradesertivirga mongoliensis TaxID=2100740 RepID=A0ABW4ZQ28_9SPHI|nr:hypothetical protein [Pedobacter mongoliensis]